MLHEWTGHDGQPFGSAWAYLVRRNVPTDVYNVHVQRMHVLFEMVQSAPKFCRLFDLLRCYGEVLHGEGQLKVLALKVAKNFTKRLMNLKER